MAKSNIWPDRKLSPPKNVDWQTVRRVLTALGCETPTYGDFWLWDPLIDWNATAELLDKPPKRTALCHILDQLGRVVICEGKPVQVAVDIEANTEAEAAEILARSSHVFVKWWPPDSPGVGLVRTQVA